MRLYSSDCEYGRHDPPIGLLFGKQNTQGLIHVDSAHVRAGVHASPMWAGLVCPRRVRHLLPIERNSNDLHALRPKASPLQRGRSGG